MSDTPKLDCAGCSNTGNVRDKNEDQFLIAELFRAAKVQASSFSVSLDRELANDLTGLLLMVADGVGGGSAGEKASASALKSVLAYATHSMNSFYRYDENSERQMSAELAESVRRSHQEIRKISEASEEYSGMMTTLTMAHVIWPHAYIVQIGDSRCYLVRNNTIDQLTKDQTFVQSMIDAGVMTPEEAAQSSKSHIITQALGSNEIPQPVIKKIDLELGDVLLLCTDGLTEHLTDSEILGHTRKPKVHDVCESLERAALIAGGRDNVTVVACRFASIGVAGYQHPPK